MNQNKIKILFLIPTLQGGGSERVFTTLAQSIDPSVFEAVFVVLDGRNAFFKIKRDDIHFIDLQKPRLVKAFWAIRTLIKKEQPQIVMSTLSHLNVSMAIWSFLLSSHKTRFIARESVVMSINSKHQKYSWIFDFLTRRFYPSFDAIICQSSDMYDDLLTNYGIPSKNLHIINNPINRLDIAKKMAQKPLFAADRTSLETRRFVTVGTLTKRKGIDRLMLILSRLDFPFVFDIIGDGIEKDNLIALSQQLKIQNKVKFWGALDNPFALVGAADVFLFGSHFEGFPNVLIEAGACGTPVITFDCKGGINEIIQQGINGFVVPDNDLEAFSKALFVVIKTPLDRNKIIELTQNRFDIEIIMKKYETVFKSLAPSVG